MSTNAFHDHLDTCTQCREHPFDLCPTGMQVFHAVVRPKRVCLCDDELEADNSHCPVHGLEWGRGPTLRTHG